MNHLQLVPTQDELNLYMTIANAAAKSNHLQKLGNAEGMLCLMLYARELGINPMTALYGGIHNIQGKMEISARLMNSMILKAGHTISILEQTDEVCRLKGTRKDNGETYVCEYKIQDAEKAQIFNKSSPWGKYTSDMLYKSCLSRLARRLFADTISTAYVEGEIPTEDRKKPQIISIDKEKNIQVENKMVTECLAVENKIEETLSEEQVNVIMGMVGDDTALLERILKGYSKKYEKEISILQEIYAIDFDTIISTLEKRRTA
jgi:hypothetical protein